MNYERDDVAFPAGAYRTYDYYGGAWHVLGWQTEPDEDTDWKRTGKVVLVMIGDDTCYHFTYDPEDIEPIEREDYCGVCGQIGCAHGRVWRRGE